MSGALLATSGLTKRFGRVTVADSLDLEIPALQTVGIVGPNGAGKSSLFNLLSGDLRPDAGSVLLNGVDVTRQSSDERTRSGIGRTYQIPKPFQGMTVFENVLVASTQGAGLRRRAAQERAWSAIELCGLQAVADQRAGRLGLLQRKRLEVARACGTDPRVLLLDEVAGGLTEPEVDELVEVVRAVRASGVSIIWIEHVVRALRATVDRLICLAGGVVVAEGTADDVLEDEAVRRLYLGAPPDETLDSGAA